MAFAGQFPNSNDASGHVLGASSEGAFERKQSEERVGGGDVNEKIHHDSSSEEEDGAKRDSEVLELARKFSTQSAAKGNPFNAAEGSVLDANSPNFSARAWTKALLELESQEPDKFKPRTAGFAFKDLRVYGFGTSTDYQETVGNIVLKTAGSFRKLLGGSQRRIDILQGLDGVVHPGEMLVVLGPPGR
jgi:ATP-binding cassette subfamily G (WHITE) protein 2 (PDR)